MTLVGILLFLASPGFGCGDEDFEYGMEGMRRAIEGTWTFTFAGPQGDRTFSFSIAPGTPGADTPEAVLINCRSRQFIRAAGACSPTSSMAVAGEVVAGDPAYLGQQVRGTFSVFGTRFHSGHLGLVVGTTGQLSASITADGTAGSANLLDEGRPASPGTLVLAR